MVTYQYSSTFINCQPVMVTPASAVKLLVVGGLTSQHRAQVHNRLLLHAARLDLQQLLAVHICMFVEDCARQATDGISTDNCSSWLGACKLSLSIHKFINLYKVKWKLL